ncbi:MAG: hypothetical protein ACFE0Q_11555 [Anaerolineae bacterium]
MNETSDEQMKRRSAFIERWYKLEKSAWRIGGVILLFAAALIAVYEPDGDQWTLLGIVTCVAGSATLFMMHRQPREARMRLHFLKAQDQIMRSAYAGLGALLLVTQVGIRPLTLVTGTLLVLGAGWYQWQAQQINRLDQLRATDTDTQGEEQA